MPAEQGVTAHQAAHADRQRAAGQLTAQPHLDAVRPAGLVQLDERAEQRVGEPARLAARPASLGDPAEIGVGGGGEPVPAQPLAHVAAQVHAVGRDGQPRVWRPPGHQVGVVPLVADEGDRARRHLLLEPDLVEAAEELVSGGHRHDAAPVRAEHARRAEVGAECHRRLGGPVRGLARPVGELERRPVLVAARRHGPPGAWPAARPGSRSASAGRCCGQAAGR
jgi:hypothetical protein